MLPVMSVDGREVGQVLSWDRETGNIKVEISDPAYMEELKGHLQSGTLGSVSMSSSVYLKSEENSFGNP